MSKPRKQGDGGPHIVGTTAGGAIVSSRGGDGFEVPRRVEKKVEISPTNKTLASAPRGRLLDPRLIPVVPAHVTSDAGRQFHALLGLPTQARPASRPRGFDLEALLASLPDARATQLRRVLEGPRSGLQRRLRSFIDDPKFRALDFDAQRRALAAFELR